MLGGERSRWDNARRGYVRGAPSGELAEVRSRTGTNLLVIGIVLSIATSARADMSRPTAWAILPEAGAISSLSLTDRTAFGHRSIERGFVGDLSAAAFAGELLVPLSSSRGVPEETSSRIATRELPPAPGSAALFLSALVSVGAWQLVRSARHISFSAVPEWYHTGGPAQVGHAVAIDLDFGAMPLCSFAPPAPPPPDSFHARREFRVRFAPQHTLAVKSPRGPPVRDAL